MLTMLQESLYFLKYLLQVKGRENKVQDTPYRIIYFYEYIFEMLSAQVGP